MTGHTAAHLQTVLAWITVSDVASIVGILVILAAAWIFLRGGGGTAIATLETANRVLEARVKELEHLRIVDQRTIQEHERTISELRGRVDFQAALEPLLGWMAEHEERDQTRFDKTIAILDQIAQRLGPDPV